MINIEDLIITDCGYLPKVYDSVNYKLVRIDRKDQVYLDDEDIDGWLDNCIIYNNNKYKIDLIDAYPKNGKFYSTVVLLLKLIQKMY